MGNCLAMVCRRCAPGRLLRRCCPCIYRCLYSRHNEYFFLKFIFGIVVGTGFGAALHYTVINKLPYPWFERSVLGGTITILAGLGFGVSVQIRCMLCLVLPHFFGKNGRGILTSLAVVYLMAGPIKNILDNGQESARSISCTAALSFNHSKEIFDLLHRPFTNAFRNLELQKDDIEALADKVKAKFRSFQDELERKVEGRKEKEQEDYGKKMEFRCEDIFSKSVDKCRDVFRDKEKDCYKALKVPGVKHLLCLPLKMTFLCRIFQVFDFMCDKAPVDTNGLMDTYYETKRALKNFANNFKADLKWQVTQLLSLVERVSVQELQAAVNHEIARKKLWFDLIIGITRAVLSVTFILVFKSAFEYNNRYLREIRFDNVYMTSYFMKIDRRRRREGRKSLLPLKKSEQKELVEPFKCKLQKAEKGKFLKSILRLLPQILVTIFIIAIDYIFFSALDLIQRHSQVDFKFNDCLPVPNKVKRSTNILIMGLWMSVLALLYFEAYGLRIRRVICAFFYPKREKKRVLFLYNENLKKRAGFLRHARRKVRRMVKEQNLLKEIGILAELRHSYPRMCGWLFRLGLGKKRCLICAEVESKGARHCKNRRCTFMYCRQCYDDVQGVCYACTAVSDSDDESSSEWDI
ncbi:E3 ubiquitin-protein ligase DCST1-like [Lytechinus variegatus]|uniref:E3 ubiquitin-protein ligase DCST1-like n=1 Tax=Lytechinus variegatus TaxID=7654 RepID=UPI001BB17080|nr:E3 ubiquitin-protein ligase DCST1-like [Lytechinus variegatus]